MFSTYQLGILRCCSVYSDGKIVVKSKYRYFLEQLQPALSLGIYQSNTRTGKLYYMKGSFAYNLPEYEDDIFFAQVYLELHGSFDYISGKYKKVRLRIYGNFSTIYSINKIIAIHFYFPQKTIQHAGKSRYCLYFTGHKELSIMCDFFMSQDPCFLDFWRKGIKMLKDLG